MQAFLPLTSRARVWDYPKREQIPFDLRLWYNSLMNEEFPRKTPFGFLLPRGKVRNLLLSMFVPYSVSFAGSPDVELSDELAIRDRELARWTPLGWRFLAGETWKARSNLWN